VWGWTNPTKTSNRNHCARYAKINRNDNVTIQNVANGQTQEMKYKSREPNRFRTMGIGTNPFYFITTKLHCASSGVSCPYAT
jgi:hypothetical protein